MNKIICPIMLTVLTVSYGWSQTPGNFEKGWYLHQGDTLPYQILRPSDFDPSRRYPLIVFLHGAGERGKDNEKQLTHGGDLFRDSTALDRYRSIVVFPQCPQESYWASVERSRDASGKRKFQFDHQRPPSKSMNMLLSFLDSLVALKEVDRSRIYLGGLSMGGMGTFELVYRRPEVFAAAFPICGGGDPAGAEKYAHEVSFWIFHGADDEVVPYQLSEQMAEAIRSAAGSVKFSLYPHTNHNSWEKAFAEPELFRWLFSHVKSSK